jgi:acyl-CoA dehydrogenase
MYKLLFNSVKSILPKVSETEIIALKSGGVSLDREIFRGKIDFKNLFRMIPVSCANENKFIQETDKLLKNTGSHNIYPHPEIEQILKDLGKKGFLSMIIDKKYNGNKLSITTQSKVLTKISSYNPSLGVVVMVPNSLGPAELLQHYGTENQKNYFLPKLADGSFIPCFGLTGPNNGSDATGQIDKGIVTMVENKVKIKVTLNKRYITLAPVANLIGVAFNVQDPENLLGKQGITVALLEKGDPNIIQDTFHNPNNSGFPNGTIKGTILIDPSQVIGGADKIGDGWKMLMECLAVGRGVSLPAQANGSSKLITHGIFKYIQLRKQFNMPIGNMEAVKEKFIRMYINTWIIHTSVALTNCILDSGSTPSVLTAIMKQQTTERARSVLLDGMDIYAGSGICIGENNFLTKFYNASPVGITVEGSNTLTRGLIIFGQGLNKSHPFIFPIFQSIQDNDHKSFRKNFNEMLKEIVFNYSKILVPSIFDTNLQKLNRLTLKFSLLSNFVALLGGKIKSKQMISGLMADSLSNIYLSYSLIWYHQVVLQGKHSLLRDSCLDSLIFDTELLLNKIISNYPFPFLKPFLYPLKCKIPETKLESINDLYKYILNEKQLESIFKEDLYIENTVLEKMEQLSLMKSGTDYMKLYQEIISVGEFKLNKM